jgi:hypothetical protein
MEQISISYKCCVDSDNDWNSLVNFYANHLSNIILILSSHLIFPREFRIRNSVCVCMRARLCVCEFFTCTKRLTVPPLWCKIKNSRKCTPSCFIFVPPTQLSTFTVYAAVHVPFKLLSFSKRIQNLIRIFFLTFSVKINYLIDSHKE